DRAKANFEAEMDRLRREGWRKVKEEEEERMSKAKVPATTFGVRPAPQFDTRDTSITVRPQMGSLSVSVGSVPSLFLARSRSLSISGHRVVTRSLCLWSSLPSYSFSPNPCALFSLSP